MRCHVTEDWVRDESVQLDDAAAARVVEEVRETLGADAEVTGNAERIVTRVTVEAVSDQAAAQAGRAKTIDVMFGRPFHHDAAFSPAVEKA